MICSKELDGQCHPLEPGSGRRPRSLIWDPSPLTAPLSPSNLLLSPVFLKMDSKGLLVADHDSNKQPFIEGSECYVDLHQHPRQLKLSVLRRIVTLVLLLPCLLWISVYATDLLGFRKKDAGFESRCRLGEDKVYYDVSEVGLLFI